MLTHAIVTCGNCGESAKINGRYKILTWKSKHFKACKQSATAWHFKEEPVNANSTD